MSRSKGAGWKRRYALRQASWPARVDRANAAYDKVHGGARVVGALRHLGSAGTQAAFPARPEHRSTPPWIALADDPPLPGSGPREDLIAVARPVDLTRPMFAVWED